MLWVKSLHIVFMVTWFAGLFYLPRLFVYHAMTDDQPSRERFKIMERKLYWGIMTPGGVLTIVFGVWLWLGWFRRAGGRRLFRHLGALLSRQPLVAHRLAQPLAHSGVRLPQRARPLRGGERRGLAALLPRRAHAAGQRHGAEEPAEEPGVRHAAHQGCGVRPE